MNGTLSARVLVEAIGTFLLALTIQMVVLRAPDLSAFAPLAVGLMLTAIVYAGGPVSAAMYNPAIVLLFRLGRKFPTRECGPYLLAQFVAALAAAGVALVLRGPAEIVLEPSAGSIILAECVFTFALAWIILQVTARHSRNNAWFGLAIGFVVAGGSYAVGTVSGAAFNPAVWLSLAVTGKIAWHTWWMYLLGEVAGVLLAVAFQRVIEQEAPPCEPTSPS